MKNQLQLGITAKILQANICKDIFEHSGGTRGVMVIVVGNGHGETSSNPGRD